MGIVINAVFGCALAVGVAGDAWAQSAAAASAPANAASRLVPPPRNPAAVAAENAKEPGAQRPDERVIPQITLPLRAKTVPATGASAPTGSLPGAVNDGAARCLAAGTAADKAACERRLAASTPSK